MRIYLGVPDRPGPHPGILVAQHAGGVDTQIQDTVHRLFREGYVAAAPELFHRQPTDMDPGKRTVALLDKEMLAELTRLKKVHEFHLYLNTAHAFQDFTRERYRERASRASWTEMLAFFTEHLKRGAVN